MYDTTGSADGEAEAAAAQADMDVLTEVLDRSQRAARRRRPTNYASFAANGREEDSDWSEDEIVIEDDGLVSSVYKHIHAVVTRAKNGSIKFPTRGGGTYDHHVTQMKTCLLYTSPSPRDGLLSRMPSSA